jgi:predicted DNA-binding ribbon-helix-helix protein
MVYNYFMSTIEKAVRQSVSLPSPLAKRVKALAKNRKVSSNRILVELVETGLRSKEEEKRRFFELTDRLSTSTDAKEQQELKGQLARMTFGE